MEIKLSSIAESMTESATLRMAQLSRELSSKGIDVINLSLGEPDFDTPIHIKLSAKDAIDRGITKYTPVAGTLELRQAISDKFKRENNLEYAPGEIIVSNGAKQSFANLCFALLNPGDEVIVFAPYWVSYYEIIKMAGGTPILVDSTVANNYKPSVQELSSKLSDKTRFIIFSSPCNPTGTVFHKEDYNSYLNILNKYPNVLIVADEIYEHIIFDQKHFSIGSIPDMKHRTVTINGFSKGFSMTGWRLGYLGGPKSVVDACVKIQGQFTSGASAFTQYAGMVALTSDLKPTIDMCSEFRMRRNLMYDGLRSIPKVIVNKPEGAFYFLPDISQYFNSSNGSYHINNSEDLAIYLLNEAHVAVVSGDAFGAPNCLRMSYSLSQLKLQSAIDRIKQALSNLQ